MLSVVFELTRRIFHHLDGKQIAYVDFSCIFVFSLQAPGCEVTQKSQEQPQSIDVEEWINTTRKAMKASNAPHGKIMNNTGESC